MKNLKWAFILAFFLFGEFVFAKKYELKVSATEKFVFDKSVWAMGSGSFIPNTTKLNIYSHKKKKEFQVLYEDLFIPKAQLKERLPEDCINLINESEFENAICRFEDKNSKDKHALQFTTVFKSSKPNIVKVRTVYLIGNKVDVETLAKQIDLNKVNKAEK